MSRLRFTGPIAAIGLLVGVFIALELLQALITHVTGKPDVDLVQVLAALTPVLITVLYGIAATAHSRADNAEFRAQRIEQTVEKVLNGQTVPPVAREVDHGNTPQTPAGS